MIISKFGSFWLRSAFTPISDDAATAGAVVTAAVAGLAKSPGVNFLSVTKNKKKKNILKVNPLDRVMCKINQFQNEWIERLQQGNEPQKMSNNFFWFAFTPMNDVSNMCEMDDMRLWN